MRLLPKTIVVGLLAAAVVTTVSLRHPSPPPATTPLGSPPLVSAPPQQAVAFPGGELCMLKGYSHEFDEERGIEWTRPRQDLPSATDDIYLYFGAKEGVIQRIKKKEDVVLRIVAEADGRTTTFLSPYCRLTPTVQRHDNTPAGASRETTTFGIVASEDVADVRKIASAERVVLRFLGTLVTEEREVPVEQLESMRDVINVYEALTGKPWSGEERPSRDSSCN